MAAVRVSSNSLVGGLFVMRPLDSTARRLSAEESRSHITKSRRGANLERRPDRAHVVLWQLRTACPVPGTRLAFKSHVSTASGRSRHRQWAEPHPQNIHMATVSRPGDSDPTHRRLALKRSLSGHPNLSIFASHLQARQGYPAAHQPETSLSRRGNNSRP